MPMPVTAHEGVDDINFDHAGQIAVGERADLVIADHWIGVKKVILRGREAK